MLVLLRLFWISRPLRSLALFVTKICWCICDIILRYNCTTIFKIWLENVWFFRLLVLSLIIYWCCFFDFTRGHARISLEHSWAMCSLKICLCEIWALSLTVFSSVLTTSSKFIFWQWLWFSTSCSIFSTILLIFHMILLRANSLIILCSLGTWYLLFHSQIWWETFTMTNTTLSSNCGLLSFLIYSNSIFMIHSWAIFLLNITCGIIIVFDSLITGCFFIFH